MAALEFLTIPDVCRELKITRSTYHRRVRPTLKQVQVGRQVRVCRTDLEVWIAEHVQEGGRNAG